MEQTLVLNATYEPVKIVDWQRAITLWVQGKVEILAERDIEKRAVTFTFRLPSVVRRTARPIASPIFRVSIGRRNTPESWRDYLYWHATLEG